MSSRKGAHLSARIVLVGAILLVGAVDVGQAQNGAAAAAIQPADSAAFEPTTSTVDGAQSAGLTQGLPRRAPQPRTLHDFWPAFAVLALLWSATVIYVLGFNRSLGRIAARMEAAEGRRVNDEAR